MAENPPDAGKDPTRAENIVLSLGDKFAATANARSVYGEPVRACNRTIVPVAQVGYGLGASSGGRNGTPLEGVAEGVELARDLSVTSRLPMRGPGMWRSRRSGR
jgi:hypothetical protein